MQVLHSDSEVNAYGSTGFATGTFGVPYVVRLEKHAILVYLVWTRD